jgi:hypothetical protein
MKNLHNVLFDSSKIYALIAKDIGRASRADNCGYGLFNSVHTWLGPIRLDIKRGVDKGVKEAPL